MATTQNIAPLPGSILAEEIEERGWAQRDLAFVMGVPETTVNKLISGKLGISPDMAEALGVAFDVSPEFFMNLQQAYEQSRARKPATIVASRSRIQSVYPLREMIRRNWVADSQDSSVMEEQLARFFRVSNLDAVPQIKHVARKSYYNSVPSVELAWLFRVKQMAQALSTPKFSDKALREVLPELHRFLSEPEEIRHVPRLLNEVGVRFVVVEKLTGSKMDGVCFWLDSSSPVIGMSIRYDRIDNFWFVLRHEIEHVLNRDGRDREVLDIGLEGENAGLSENIPSQERRANTAASNFIVPRDKLSSFVARVSPLYSEHRIVQFAFTHGVHPGLVVGQLHGTGNLPHSHFRKFLVKIRNIITSTALTDGWGNVAPFYQ